MPVTSPAHKLYVDLVAKGYDKSSAAKIAQEKTGLSLVTGRPPKTKGHGATYKGQYK